MKAICLASAMTIVLLSAVTLILRINQSGHRLRSLLMLYLGLLALLVIVWKIVPPSCGFLPVELQVEPVWLDLLLCIFFFSSAFFGGILQLYNLTDRGFSLRILIDILEAPEHTTNVANAAKNYAAGRGIAWMYDKRVRGLVGGGLAVYRNGHIALTVKGTQLADLLISLRRFLQIGPILK